ncbi:transposase [Streptomyces sp. NPDC054829]
MIARSAAPARSRRGSWKLFRPRWRPCAARSWAPTSLVASFARWAPTTAKWPNSTPGSKPASASTGTPRPPSACPVWARPSQRSFIAATGGDLTALASSDRLTGFAGLAPVPWDSERSAGTCAGPIRYHRDLQCVLCLSAQVSVLRCPASKAHYDRKRKEGKGRKQAVLALALARRRVNVLWAMISDRRPFQTDPSLATAA